jgi:hypothetical protein
MPSLRAASASTHARENAADRLQAWLDVRRLLLDTGSASAPGRLLRILGRFPARTETLPDRPAVLAHLFDKAAGLRAAVEVVKVANDRGAFGAVKLRGECGQELFEDAEG